MDGPVCPSWQSFQESSVDRIVWRLLRIAINGNLREGCLRTIENIRRWWCGTTNPGLVAYVRDHSSKIKWYQAVIFFSLESPPSVSVSPGASGKNPPHANTPHTEWRHGDTSPDGCLLPTHCIQDVRRACITSRTTEGTYSARREPHASVHTSDTMTDKRNNKHLTDGASMRSTR